MTDKKSWFLMCSLTRKEPWGMGERPKVSQICFIRASFHFLSMPEHPCAVEERPGSVGMPSWGAPATPRECPRRSKECPGERKWCTGVAQAPPRMTKNVVRTPPDAENRDCLKIDDLPRKNMGFRGSGDQQLTKSGPHTLPSEPQTAQNADFSA